ncbi:MAG: transketolase-like TK C-terminal-containing protein [Candidatus Omnitrophota bacterium]
MTLDNIGVDSITLKKSADYVRYLSLECIERANSGHPGLPLGCAELGLLLYRYILRYNPDVPNWANRDRFILSAGHGSMLLYSLLYLTGYPFTLDDLGNFRQLGSKTPGHPEYNIPEGIETTTGPLGQGFANAVGCAIEGKMLASRFNKKNPDVDLFDYTVYALMGDGCNMEGITYEAASIAGHLGLDNLVIIYDYNQITIDGRIDITYSEDVEKRYEAMGWHVERTSIKDISDTLSKLNRLEHMREGKPKLLVLETTIGEGLNKKRDKTSIHGAAAGIEEIVYFIQNSDMRSVFEDIYGKEAVADTDRLTAIVNERLQKKSPLPECNSCNTFMARGADEGKKAFLKWEETLGEYRSLFPAEYAEYLSYVDFKVSESLKASLLHYKEDQADSTRSVSGRVLNRCAKDIPQIIGGCADLAGSTKASVDHSPYITKHDFSGRNIAFGVREHAMSAICNGLALNKAMIPFSSTFFTFFDYMKPSVRLAALMKLKHMFIFSHDSIYVGEDGPTHQPVEHLNTLRLIPGIYTFRPANDIETAFAYLYFFDEMHGPMAVVTSRQKVSPSSYRDFSDRETLYEQFKKGAYVFYETPDTQGHKPDLILCGSGSELSTAMETAKMVEQKDHKHVRVVSIPCLELFNQSDSSYQKELLMPGIPAVFIEACSHKGFHLFYDPRFMIVDVGNFGVSAPDKKCCEYFGLTPEHVYERMKKELK